MPKQARNPQNPPAKAVSGEHWSSWLKYVHIRKRRELKRQDALRDEFVKACNEIFKTCLEQAQGREVHLANYIRLLQHYWGEDEVRVLELDPMASQRRLKIIVHLPQHKIFCYTQMNVAERHLMGRRLGTDESEVREWMHRKTLF